MTTHKATCMECTWTQFWPSKDEAERAETWHVYDDHPDVWLFLMGDRPPGVVMPGWVDEPDRGSVCVVGGRWDGMLFTRHPGTVMLRWRTDEGACPWSHLQQVVNSSGGRLVPSEHQEMRR